MPVGAWAEGVPATLQVLPISLGLCVVYVSVCVCVCVLEREAILEKRKGGESERDSWSCRRW